ncbi:MAG: dienelactone hydrolase family protein [Gemmatimonadota bacterium]|nr:dienelactone hydrolase family protein [Gemmatimonadota bacterium]
MKIEKLDQGVYDLFDHYVHGQINRREFLDQASRYAVAGLTATAMFDFLSPDYVHAQQIEPQDARLKSEYMSYDSPEGGGTIRGLLSRPAGNKDKLPGIVVVHENRGLNPHIEDVARRAGLAGFIAYAPDALTPLGGYPGNDDDGRSLQRQRDRNKMLEDFMAAYGYLKSHPECSGKVGVVGFCFGGWISNMMAVRLSDLGAAVPFYGSQPADEEVTRINAPLLLQYAGLDKRINEGWPAFEAALKTHKKEYTAHIYPEVNHGFHNDTTPRYDKATAELAWQRTIDFFNEKLR